MKLAAVLLIAAGGIGMGVCVGQRGGVAALTVPFAFVMLAGVALRFGDRDVLGDPPDLEGEREGYPTLVGRALIRYTDEHGQTQTLTVAVDALEARDVRIRAFACIVDATMCSVQSREGNRNAYLAKPGDAVSVVNNAGEVTKVPVDPPRVQ